jgi:hypothetical protein
MMIGMGTVYNVKKGLSAQEDWNKRYMTDHEREQYQKSQGR